MPTRLKHVCFLLVAASRGSAGLVTSIITVVEASSSATPCTELSPISNRMQWAKQCAMAPSNILPTGLSAPASTTCSGSDCSTPSTILSKQSFISSSRGSRNTETTSSKRRNYISTNTSTSTRSPRTGSSDGGITTNKDDSSDPEIGVIVGAMCCVFAVVALLGWILWRSRNKWLSYLKGSNAGVLDAHEKYWWDNRSFQDSDRDATPKFWSRSPQELDESPTAPRDYSRSRSYAVTNPDPPSASMVIDKSPGDSNPSHSELRSEASEVEDPTSRPNSHILSSISRNDDLASRLESNIRSSITRDNDTSSQPGSDVHSSMSRNDDAASRPDSDILSSISSNDDQSMGVCPTPMPSPPVYTPYRPPESETRSRSPYLTPEQAMAGGWRNSGPNDE